jgi:hypothetical protein
MIWNLRAASAAGSTAGLALFAQRLLIPDSLDKLDSFFPVIKQATFATSTHGPTTSSLDLASSISHPGGEIDIFCGYRASSTRACPASTL